MYNPPIFLINIIEKLEKELDDLLEGNDLIEDDWFDYNISNYYIKINNKNVKLTLFPNCISSLKEDKYYYTLGLHEITIRSKEVIPDSNRSWAKEANLETCFEVPIKEKKRQEEVIPILLQSLGYQETPKLDLFTPYDPLL